jgi:Mn-dependent DtxR family transcriptional regulator
MTISATIKAALENTVLCRGGNGPKESYEYAEKMEVVIKQSIQERLMEALESPETLEESICQMIEELSTKK